MTAKIKLNAASGGGSFSLQAPSSSSNNRVMTLPDTADGTILTTTNPKTGNILQVVSSNKDDTFSTNATSYTSIGLNATITPSSTSSKILVLMDLVFGGTQNSYNFGRIIRTPSGGSATAIAIGEDRTSSYSNSQQASFSMTCLNNANAIYKNWHASVNFYDSPNTTAATTYAVQGKSLAGGSDGYFYINRMYSNDNAAYQVGYSSNLTLMEVAA